MRRHRGELDTVGRLYDLIQEHIDRQAPYPPSPRRIAKELGVTQTAMNNWREPKGLVKKDHLLAIARVTRNPYSVVRDAMLEDIGYLQADPPAPPTPPRPDRRPKLA